MFDMNDILTRLQNGESADAIAAEFTKSLNDAEAKMKEAAVKNQKREDFKAAMGHMLNFLEKYYPDNIIFQEAVKLEDADYDKMLAEIEAYLKMDEAFGKMFKAMDRVPEPEASAKSTSADDVLRAWINRI